MSIRDISEYLYLAIIIPCNSAIVLLNEISIVKMSGRGQETEESNFVDLTLDERFGYSRKTPFHHQVDSTGVKIEDVDSVKKKNPDESCWDEIDWHLGQMEKYQDMGEDFEADDGKVVRHYSLQ